jgi:hypothetical protein
VYWFRRSAVIVVALSLVFGIGHLLGGGSGSQPPRATNTAAHPKSRTSTPATVPTSTASAPVGKTGTKAKPTKAPLAQPDGPCRPDEVTATPATRTASAGGRIRLLLDLTSTRAACTFTVAPTSLVLRISSGSDRIWSSQDCPKAIAARDVVVRSAVPVQVPVTWSGRRSDSACSPATSWAEPGFYHAVAAVLGSTPTDVQFRLVLPKRPVVTRTAKPKQKPTPSATPSATASSSASPSASASSSGPVD